MASTSHRSARWLLVLALVLGGCAPVARGTAKSVTEGATGGSVQALADPATRQRVEDFVGSPEMQKAIRGLSDDIASGVTDGMTSDEVAARSERLARSITETVTQTEMRTMAKELPRTLGPAVAAMLHDQLEDPSFRAVLGSVVFEVSRQAVFGTNQATAELSERKRKEGAVAHLSGSVDTAGTWKGVAIAVLLAAIVGLIVALLWTRAKVRRHEVAHEIAHNVRHDGTDGNRHGPEPST